MRTSTNDSKSLSHSSSSSTCWVREWLITTNTAKTIARKGNQRKQMIFMSPKQRKKGILFPTAARLVTRLTYSKPWQCQSHRVCNSAVSRQLGHPTPGHPRGGHSHSHSPDHSPSMVHSDSLTLSECRIFNRLSEPALFMNRFGQVRSMTKQLGWVKLLAITKVNVVVLALEQVDVPRE